MWENFYREPLHSGTCIPGAIRQRRPPFTRHNTSLRVPCVDDCFLHCCSFADCNRTIQRPCLRPERGVLPGATVTLLNLQTNLTRSTQTNGEGLYEFPLVKPGSYKLTVSQSGFDTATSPEFTLEVNQIATQDFKLKSGRHRRRST